MQDSRLMVQEKTIKDGENRILAHYKKHFHTSVKQKKEWEPFVGAELPIELISNQTFRNITEYGYSLFEATLTRDMKELAEEVVREVDEWEGEGALCIHISSILYTLFTEAKIFDHRTLHFIQGYYRHETRPDNLLALSVFGKEHVGLHCWLVAKGGVIDVTIGQERDFFDFGGFSFILGKVPEGMKLNGKKEPKKMVENYQKDFAKKLGVTKEEWVSRHVAFFQEWEKNHV